MNVFIRVLGYAPRLMPRILTFFVFALLGVIFSAIYLGLIIPMLELLFDETQQQVPEYPSFSLSFGYLKSLFNYHFLNIKFQQGPLAALVLVCLLLVGSVFLSNLFRYFERMTASSLKVDVVRNIRLDLFKNVTHMHVGFFSDKRKGDLISRFTNDISEIENAVVNSLKSVMKEPIHLLVYLIVLFMLSVKLTLFTLIVFPITGGVIAEIIKRLRRKAKQSQEAMGRIVNILDETFGGMRVINAFNARDFVLQKMEKEATYHRKVNLSISRKNEMASPLSEFLGVIIVAFVVYFGGRDVLYERSELTPASFLVFLAFYASMIQPAKNFSNGITSLQKGTVAGLRVFQLIDAQPSIASKPDAIKLTAFTNEVAFRGVGFAYDRDAVLTDINLVLRKGKTIALVGHSGSGKSTLADLVPRFYDPLAGEVLLDGINLKDYDLESLRAQIGVVTQESILFNDTIFNNIAFGLHNVREEDVIHAAKVANAHDFIMQTPYQYQTSIGERGSKLSGGQRQRISIARAILKNPPILILDEATSALDSESERLVQDAITNLMKNRTSLVIAHRLSTIKHADEIIVLQEGRIVERGLHEELMIKGGVYQKLNEMQHG